MCTDGRRCTSRLAMRAAAVAPVAPVLLDVAVAGAVLLALVRRARADVAWPPFPAQARRRRARAAAGRAAASVVRPVPAAPVGVALVARRTTDRRSPTSR